jgi:uncharacterized membrane protein YfcA
VATDYIFILVGLLAGMIDSMVGGGGLISLPFLLGTAGLSPALALGTNKLQSSLGTTLAVYNYRRMGLFSVRKHLIAIVWTALGAAIGCVAVLYIDADQLKKVIPFFLGGVLLLNILKPSFGELERRARMKDSIFDRSIGFALGFYDGFFGPGTGVFWTSAWIQLRGYTIRHATGLTKLVNLSSNICSVAVFAIAGSILWREGFLMGLGNCLGAWVGSTIVGKINLVWMKRIFFTISLAILASLVQKVF